MNWFQALTALICGALLWGHGYLTGRLCEVRDQIKWLNDIKWRPYARRES